MRFKRFSSPRNIRLYSSQEVAINEMFRDKEYCVSKGFYNASDFIRDSINPKIREYEMYKFRQDVSS